MSARENTLRRMPDVAGRGRGRILPAALDRVGMDEIEMPVLIAQPDGTTQRVSARVAAFVDLGSAEARGIHMSRLYLHLDRHLSAEPLTPCTLRRVLRDFLDSHADLSRRAEVRIRFDHLIRRASLAQRAQRLARVSGRDRRAPRRRRFRGRARGQRAVFEHVSRVGRARAPADPGTLRRRFRRSQDDRSRRGAGLARQRSRASSRRRTASAARPTCA